MTARAVRTAARIARRSASGALALAATALGLVSLRYLSGDVDVAPAELRESMTARPAWFAIHAGASAVALAGVPWQLAGSLRQKRPGLHRALGRLYAAAVLVGGVSAIPLALGSWAGPVATAGFLALAAAWLATTGLGVRAARAGAVEAHRRWMMRSAALTCAALTLRLYLPLPGWLGVAYVDGYRIIAWMCWLPNLAFAELWLRRRATPAAPQQMTVTVLVSR